MPSHADVIANSADLCGTYRSVKKLFASIFLDALRGEGWGISSRVSLRDILRSDSIRTEPDFLIGTVFALFAI